MGVAKEFFSCLYQVVVARNYIKSVTWKFPRERKFLVKSLFHMSASREWTMFPVSKMRLLAAASKVALSFSLECSLRKDPHVGLCKKEGFAFGK